MKKIFLVIIASLFASSALALSTDREQKEATKQPKVYIPEKGDWALGFNAAPILSYLGNLFNGNTANNFNPKQIGGAITTNGVFTNDDEWLKPIISLNSKYMISDKVGIRANIGLNVKKGSSTVYVTDDEAINFDPLSQSKVVDNTITRSSGACVSIGAEYRVGKRRVQGVFGGNYIIGGGDIVTEYIYGNKMTSLNQQPTTYSGSTSSRPLINHVGNFYTGLSAFAGFEWFVAPKIALGAEVSLAAIYCYKQQRYNKSESFDSTLNDVCVKTNITTPPSHNFSLGTDSISGTINLNFYF